MDNRVAEVALKSCAVAIAVGLLFAHRAQAAAATDLLIRATAASFKVGANGMYNVTVSNVGGAAHQLVIECFVNQDISFGRVLDETRALARVA